VTTRRHRPSRLVGLIAAATMACAGCTTDAPPSSVGPVTSSVAPTTSMASPPAPSAPALAPQQGESWIAYQLWDGRADIRLARPDGTGDHALLPGAGSGPETTHPDWSPDGNSIAYVADNAIWIANVDGSGSRQASSPCIDPCSEDYPAWSPDGSTIAYARWQADGNVVTHGTIAVLDHASGAETQVLTTEGPEYPAYPRWSPDGKSIVVELDRFVDTGVEASLVVGSVIATFVVAEGAASLVRLTKADMFAAYPDWSPDGGRIVFSTYDLGYRDGGSFADASRPSDLYTIAPDGTHLSGLTHNASGTTLVRNGTASGPLSTQPSWSPDGRSIIFVQVDGATWPGWRLASLRPDVTHLEPTRVPADFRGTHPRVRPLP
jgi:Tol biopolymer transport system component